LRQAPLPSTLVKEEEDELPTWGYTFPMPRVDHTDSPQYQGGVHLVGAYTQYAKPHPRVPTFLSAVYWHVTAEDPPEDDDDLDY
jgi:hypothetical protein